MGEKTSISWTDHTFNPWWGCVKVSPACMHCYAERDANRYGMDLWGPRSDRRFFGDDHWKQPVKWNKKAQQDGVKRRVFCASMSDLFERHVISEINDHMTRERARVFALIEQTPNLIWLLLTKRSENILDMLPQSWQAGAPDNVWFGVSLDNNQYLPRLYDLAQVKCRRRFISAEPLLSELDLSPYFGWWLRSHDIGEPGIDWIITGCESGPGARQTHPRDFDSLRLQSHLYGAKFFLKQMMVDGKLVKEPFLNGRQWLEVPSDET